MLCACADDGVWTPHRRVCLTDALSVNLGVTDNAGARSLTASSFDALARFCRALLDEARRQRDFAVAAAVLQASGSFFRKDTSGGTASRASPASRAGLSLQLPTAFTKAYLTTSLAGEVRQQAPPPSCSRAAACPVARVA